MMETSTTLTKKERRQFLQEKGFVRVDGLTAFGPGPDEKRVIGEHLPDLLEEELGKWDYNNGVYAVVTTDREIWIRAADGTRPPGSFFDVVTPNKSGCFVPCSNGEWPLSYHLLVRIANPDYQPE